MRSKKVNAHSKREERVPFENTRIGSQKWFRQFTNIQNEKEITKRIYWKHIWPWMSLHKGGSGRWEEATPNPGTGWRPSGRVPGRPKVAVEGIVGVSLGVRNCLTPWLNEATGTYCIFIMCFMHNYNFVNFSFDLHPTYSLVFSMLKYLKLRGK